jgi:hypothetical protein
VDDSINILGIQNANKLIHELWHQSIASLQFNHALSRGPRFIQTSAYKHT